MRNHPSTSGEKQDTLGRENIGKFHKFSKTKRKRVWKNRMRGEN